MNVLFIVDRINIENLGIMVLSSILKKEGHNVDIVEIEYEKFKQKLKANSSPNVLAYSIHSMNVISRYLAFNFRISKELKAISVFGGPYIASHPEIIHESDVDGVCLGEGDYALLDLVNNLSEGKSLTGIANWWIKHDGQIFRNPARPLIEDLDKLPFADRTLFPDPYPVSVMTSRGCAYGCTFCTEKSKFRHRSVDNVIEELSQIKLMMNPRFVYFTDSTFNISLSWLREFSEKYSNKIGLPFYCCVRADLVNQENIEYLKRAGCYCVGMGIETANDYLRNEVLKRGMSKEQIIMASQIIKRNNIRLRTGNMISIPSGTLEDDLATLKLNIKCRPVYAKANVFFPYENTDLYYLLIKQSKYPHLNTDIKKFLAFWESHDSNHDTRRIKNLHKLFSLVVSFPFLLPFLPLLLNLPLHKFYTLLDNFWREYCCYSHIWSSHLSKRKFFLMNFIFLKFKKRIFNLLKH